jgi:hypothetical protein
MKDLTISDHSEEKVYSLHKNIFDVASSDSDTAQYVDIRILLRLCFLTHNGDQNHHTKDLVKYIGLIFCKFAYSRNDILSDVFNIVYLTYTYLSAILVVCIQLKCVSATFLQNWDSEILNYLLSVIVVLCEMNNLNF